MSKKSRITTIALTIALVLPMLLLSSSCKKDTIDGNIHAISTLNPGDTYAIIKLKGFDGELTFLLFEEIAPVGVNEFARAANNRYYDNKTIHRVLPNGLIQGGALNPNGSEAAIPEEEMFAVETHPNARNFFGALGFAVDPETGMNYRQFHVITANKPVDIDEEAAKIKDIIDQADDDGFTPHEKREYDNLQKELTRFPDAVKERYSEQGGLHLLDGHVTVFGQLISGWDLLEELASVELVAGNRIDDDNPNLGNGNGQNSRPLDDIFIETIRIIRNDDEEE